MPAPEAAGRRPYHLSSRTFTAGPRDLASRHLDFSTPHRLSLRAAPGDARGLASPRILRSSPSLRGRRPILAFCDLSSRTSSLALPLRTLP